MLLKFLDVVNLKFIFKNKSVYSGFFIEVDEFCLRRWVDRDGLGVFYCEIFEFFFNGFNGEIFFKEIEEKEQFF